MQSVDSSNLKAAGYDARTKILRIEFYSGVYDYYDVSESIYNGLLNAKSKGSYHHQHIKNNYRYNKIR